MNIKMIRSLADIVNSADLSSIEVEQDGLRVKITREREVMPIAYAAAPIAPAPVEAAKPAAAVDSPGMDFNNARSIKSPMVGVFYQATGPGEKPFVQIGSKVKKGDVLCIIEAMKLMNEINALEDGEVVDICVSDGDVVEFGQTLFKII